MQIGILCAVIVAAGVARAEAPTPGSPRGQPATLALRWPRVPPCARLAAVNLRGIAGDVLRWSNAAGVQQTMTVAEGRRPTRLRPELVQDLPTSLTWERSGVNTSTPGIDVGNLLFIEVACDGRNGGVIWSCAPEGCSPSLAVPYATPAAARAHRAAAHVKQALQQPARARALVTANALAVIEHACHPDRCTDRVAPVKAALQALAAQPPWEPERDKDRLRLWAPHPSSDSLLCDRNDCWLRIGSFSFHETTASRGDEILEESLPGGVASTWSLHASSSSLLITGTAVR